MYFRILVRLRELEEEINKTSVVRNCCSCEVEYKILTMLLLDRNTTLIDVMKEFGGNVNPVFVKRILEQYSLF